MAEVNENAGAVVENLGDRYGHSKIVGRVCRSLRPIRLDTGFFYVSRSTVLDIFAFSLNYVINALVHILNLHVGYT